MRHVQLHLRSAELAVSRETATGGQTSFFQKDHMSSQPNSIHSRKPLSFVREAPVSPQNAARFLNMHPKTILRKAREGAVPGHPVGGNRKRWHFYLSELDHWLRCQVISGSHPRRPQGDYIG